MRKFSLLLPGFFVSAVLLLSGCTTPPTHDVSPVSPVPPEAPEKVLRLAAFSDMPGWQRDKLSEAWPAFMQSCRVLKKREAWRHVCQMAEKIDAAQENQVRRFFETFLEPYQIVTSDGKETGMSTGYYEPLLRGSRTRTAQYQIPLYSVPPDLIVVDLAAVYPKLKGMRLRGRLEGQRLLPYPSRGEIRESQCLAGREIAWVMDPVDAFFLQVQGSGRVYLVNNGETIRVAYGEQNGHPYHSIGRYLVDKGEMKLEEASAQGIKKWLKEHPARLNEVLDANPSYVFFREEKLTDPKAGPKGALGVPLTGGRSVAVDPRYIPLGSPLFIDTTEPGSDVPLQHTVMAQDTGGAIKGILRMDYFWGSGHEAGEKAGKMKQPVRIWILQPKAGKENGPS